MPNNQAQERVDQARAQVVADVVPALLAAFEGLASTPPTVDQIPQLFCTPESLHDVAQWLKRSGFIMLVDIGGVDYYPNRTPRFEVVYHFRNLPDVGMVRLRVRCTEQDQIPSLSGIWQLADPAEREIWDQFGIKFKGHPNLVRILNPDDWEGHPLRRDYPVRGPRALINLEMPAEDNRYPAFVDEDEKPSSTNGK